MPTEVLAIGDAIEDVAQPSERIGANGSRPLATNQFHNLKLRVDHKEPAAAGFERTGVMPTPERDARGSPN